jgi:two-component system response regulator HydG
VITITLPPLRERRDDIEPLAQHFLESAARRMKKEVRALDGPALDLMLRYDWPGNVRELENVIERAVILARGGLVTAALLPLEGPRRTDTPLPEPHSPLVPLEEMERRHIAGVLKETGFHKSKSADILGISRKTLDRKIVEYHLEEERR